MRRRPPFPSSIAWLLIAVSSGLGASGAALATAWPPDLRLEWSTGGRAGREVAEPLRGHPGQTVEASYSLRNVGGSDAFAAILQARTALGPAGDRERLQPGPAAGTAVDRTLSLPLATGMRELCIEARLQTVEPEDPGDANPRDNRICRKVETGRESAAGRTVR